MRLWILAVVVLPGCVMCHVHEERASMYKEQGDFYYQNAHWDQAHAEYLAAIRQDPDDVETLIALIYTCRMRAFEDRKRRESWTFFTGVDRSPGRSLLEASQWAEVGFEKAPDDAQLHFAIALLFADLHRPLQAEEELNRALEADPGFPEAFLELARNLYFRSQEEWSRGEREVSLRHLREAALAALAFLNRFRERHGQSAANEPELQHWAVALQEIADHGGEITDAARAQLHLADPDFVTAPLVRELPR